ncbi:hypothetical protein L7F22_056469 [Adiantum nelumboides]|nr:hypothetical protein [Adiantum nelumboides]
MAMVGSLVLHTDEDQEDSDFFDQLANEFGDGDLGRLRSSLQREEKDRLDDNLSKLILGEEDCAPAPPTATADAIVFSLVAEGIDDIVDDNLDDNLSVGHDEIEIQGTAVERDWSYPAEEVLSIATHSPVELPQVDAPIGASDAIDSLVNLHARPSEGTENESLIVGSPSSMFGENASVVEAHVESVERRSEFSESKDVCALESGTVGFSSDLPSCSLTPIEDDESKQGSQLTLAENCSGFFSDEVPHVARLLESSTVNPIDASPDCTSVKPGNAQFLPRVDDVGSTGSPSVRELQWSCFGNSYIADASGSDFFNGLGSETLEGCNQETTAQIVGYQVEPWMDLSSTALNPQGSLGANGESFGLQTGIYSYGSAAEHFEERLFWNQQGAQSYGISEQENSSSADFFTNLSDSHRTIESKQSGISADTVSEIGSVNDLSRTSNCKAQRQEEPQQNWENMYPGWYFDYASNEWKQIEGWSPVQEQHPLREDDGPSFSQTSQSNQSVSMASDSFWQRSPGQEHWPSLPSEQSFAAGAHAASDDLQFATSSSLPEQQTNWEQQYPGWYYDYQTQQWCQIVDNNQSWASNQDPKLEASQGVELVQNLQSSGGGWIDQQVQPHYQSEVNQNIYVPERSHSVYDNSGGVDTRTLTRGMSFNSWTEPTGGGFAYGQHGMGNSQEACSINSWTGFQGAVSTVPSHTFQAISDPISQSHQDSTQADKPSYYGNAHGFFPSYNLSTGGAEGGRSSAGRPSHALVAFGFGGKLVTMKAPQLGNAEPLLLHDFNRLVSSAEGHSNVSTYFSVFNRQGLSGPLQGATSKDVLKWVEERIENFGKEDCQGMNSEGVRVLWGVLKIACQHYGKLRSVAGSVGVKSQMEDGPEVALGRLLMAAKSQSHWNEGLPTSTDLLHTIPTGHQIQAAVNEVRTQLMDGKIKEALQFAQQGQLWGVALVLAWQLGEKVYAETALHMAQQQFSPGSPMRTLLLLFAGQASELFKAQSLPLSVGTYGLISSAVSNAQDSAGGMLRDWLGNLSIIAANPTKGDEQVITHLGDSLWKDQGEVAGAHTCYLVADTTFESFSKEARLCLVGADHFKYERTFATPQAIQRTELYEYAKTLGNPQYVLVPFQPFKLLYAHMLAEVGRVTEASRYCQMVIKNLKSAGRGTEIEFCKQSALALEERLRLHSQGGYSLNFSTGKLVGKVMGTIDSTIHKIIGGPPVPQQPSPSFGHSQDWYANAGNVGSSATKAAPMIPSASNNNLFIVNNQVDVPTRSVSEPNLVRGSTQGSTQEPKSTTGSETSSASPSQLKSAGSNGGGYLHRFGSNIFAKAIGLMKHNKEAKLGDENKFYYDEKLKRWVEAGAEQSTEETVLAPPPIAASFNLTSGSPSDVKSAQGQSAGVSSSADLPPIPPSVNQFSARGRLHGVRSRYVDTFNKGNIQVAAKPSQLPLVPGAGAGWGSTSSPSNFFASASLTAETNGSSDMLANGHNNEVNSEFLKPASADMKGGHSQAENEPLLPKNLNTSFMDVPVFQKHSSTGNMVMLTDNNHTPVKTDVSSWGNMGRAVSWSGESPSTFHQRKLLNGGVGDVQAKSSSTLPSPPILEPPPSFAGYESGQMQPVAAGSMLSGSLQGAAFGEMQEVEL